MKTLRTLIAATALFLVSAAFASKNITFHGKVVTIDAGMRKTTVIIQRTGHEADTTLLGAGGMFSVSIGENEHSIMTFVQDGYITKVVDISTLNAFSKFTKEDDRSVRFDVELIPQNDDRNLAFAGPVGHLTFAKGGLMNVQYDHSMMTLPVEDASVAAR